MNETRKDANGYVGYEYREISIARHLEALYIDSLSNFGWELIAEQGYGIQSVIASANPMNIGANMAAYAVQTPPKTIDDPDMVTLKFRRDRRIAYKQELNKLERECENALTAIRRLEKKNNAQTMGAALGSGIIGTGFLALGVYYYLSSNIALCILFGVIGLAGWGIGFLANRRVERKKTAQTKPQMEAHFNAVHNACEQAHALLTQ